MYVFDTIGIYNLKQEDLKIDVHAGVLCSSIDLSIVSFSLIRKWGDLTCPSCIPFSMSTVTKYPSLSYFTFGHCSQT